MPDRDREWRRAQRERKIQQVKRWYQWGGRFDIRTEEEIDIDQRKQAVTPAKCSCWMCGNPRKWFRDVSQEEKVALERENGQDW